MLIFVNADRIATGDEYFVNVSVREKLKRSYTQISGMQSKLSEGAFEEDLIHAYEYLGKKAALLFNTLEFYNYIAYSVKEDDDGGMTRIHVRVGDIVEVSEEQEEEAYAQVKAIMLHKYNDKKFYPFFVFDWLSFTNSHHDLLQCAFYTLQSQTNQQWRRIYPLNFVDHISSSHFLHACSRKCTLEQHDPTKRLYLKNEFFYKAV